MKKRGFEIVSKYRNQDKLLPKRGTKFSAGYDLVSSEDILIKPNEIKLVPLGVKAYMQEDEVLLLVDRSSNPKKRGLVLINSVGVIDSDYYNNPDNEGLILAQMKNIGDRDVVIPKYERLVQGIFTKFLTIDKDEFIEESRSGGVGSTGR